jgi:L-asparaginase
MKRILIVTTGGTFNKIYDPIRGELMVDPTIKTVETIVARWRADYRTMACIGKDSLDMTDTDRHELLSVVSQARTQDIVIVHGTDTLKQSATLIAEAQLEKRIILTGAMVPWSIDPIEATANLAMAIGALHWIDVNGVYIAMNGIVDHHTRVKKDRKKGRFNQVN